MTLIHPNAELSVLTKLCARLRLWLLAHGQTDETLYEYAPEPVNEYQIGIRREAAPVRVEQVFDNPEHVCVASRQCGWLVCPSSSMRASTGIY